MTQTHNNGTLRTALDTLLTALAPGIWGSTYIVTTELLPPDRPFTAALIRALPAGLILLSVNQALPSRAYWPKLLILSAINIAAFQAMIFIAAYRLPGGLAAVIGAFQPLLVMALAWSLDAKRPIPLAVLASGGAIAGMALLLLSPTASWDVIGITAAFAGAFFMAAGIYLSRRWAPDMSVGAFTGWQLLLGGLMLIPVALAIDPPLPPLNAVQAGGYIYLSLGGALVAYALWFRGIGRLSPVSVSSLGLLSPVTAVLLGWVILGERLNTQGLIGLTAVLAGILAVQFIQHHSPPPAFPKQENSHV
ncbi:MAG: EamA family transporter [Alphaproteobacteria bacterium]|nr:EamA family transporter [Alphaproteobacteria bacterium]